MKLQTQIKQSLKQKQRLSQQQRYGLSILSMSDASFMLEAQHLLEENPVLECTDTSFYETNDVYERASNMVTHQETLQDVLYQQLHYSDFAYPYDLAEFLIESLDDDGYLRMESEEIAQLCGYPVDIVEACIHTLQNFEPAGVFARNLQECILIQLDPQNDPTAQIAKTIVLHHLQALAQQAYEQIADALHIHMQEVDKAVKRISGLQPRPGGSYAKGSTYIQPDARIIVEDGEIHIELLRQSNSFTINHSYDHIQDDAASAYIKKATKEAQLFIDSFAKRCQTLLAIITCICEHQKGFFLMHDHYQPLTMLQVSKELGYHVSTISRAISQKSLEFENRIIPLRKFFPHEVSGMSTGRIYERLKAIIDNENKQKPYSDAQLSNLLKKEGIDISRRTVTKYREQCTLPNAQKRRRKESHENKSLSEKSIRESSADTCS